MDSLPRVKKGWRAEAGAGFAFLTSPHPSTGDVDGNIAGVFQFDDSSMKAG
jgi:hypothetical protein